ncbi:15407_t:CDS:1, partial [Gigaspora margarita]
KEKLIMDPLQVENDNCSDYNEQDFVPEKDRNQTSIPLPPPGQPCQDNNPNRNHCTAY